MGTTLINCTNKHGDKQKIHGVKVIDSNNKNVIDVLGGLSVITKADSISEKICSTTNKKTNKVSNEEITTEGEMIVGDIEIIEPLEILGKTELPICSFPKDEIEEEIVIGFISVESPPQFKSTPKNLSIQEKRDYFSKQISDLVSKNFNTSVCLNLKGKQKIYTQFKIDKNGDIIDIKIRTPHILLEQEAERIIKLFPQFVPAKQKEKPISVVYTLPIIFQVEE